MDRNKAEREQRKKEKLLREILRKEKGDYYSILGLPRDCSSGDVKRAYKKLSLKVHPDKNKCPESADVFKIVSEAYECLKKVKKSDKTTHTSGVAEPNQTDSQSDQNAGSRSSQAENPDSGSGRTELPKYWARRQCETCGDNIFGKDARLCIYCEEELRWCQSG